MTRRFRRIGLVVLAAALAGRATAVDPSGSTSAPTESPAGATPGPPCARSAPELFLRVSPAVVSVAALSINPYDVSDRLSRVVGSGFIVDPSGLILTNSHIAFGRQAIMVTLDDGTTLPAQLVGADPVFDVAVIRIAPPAGGPLPVVQLGKSKQTAVGEEVFAIGNPLGLDQTLTRGIVSAVNRILPEVGMSLAEPLIQTDAAINPGNSGGPLVNACGEVVGITTALLPEAQNIGFAVPIDLAREVIPSLVSSGRVIRPWLGVQGQLVVSVLKELLRLPLADGFLVEVVEPGSPAEKVGLHGGQLDLIIGGQPVLIGGDIVTKVNGEAIDEPEQLGHVLRNLKVGTSIHLTVFHDGATREVECVLPERPLLPQDVAARPSVAPAARWSNDPALPRFSLGARAGF